MSTRLLLSLTLAATAAACSQQDKKPRLAEQAVVGTWRSDSVPTAAANASRFELRMASGGMAEFTRVAGAAVTVERGTWDGADSLVRVVVRGEGTAARPTSLLLAIRGGALGLVGFDTTTWGPQGLTLYRR